MGGVDCKRLLPDCSLLTEETLAETSMFAAPDFRWNADSFNTLHQVATLIGAEFISNKVY